MGLYNLGLDNVVSFMTAYLAVKALSGDDQERGTRLSEYDGSERRHDGDQNREYAGVERRHAR